MTDLPPNYESLNEEEIAEAKRHDEECRGIRERYDRLKAMEAEQRELIRKQWCEDQGFDE